MEFFTLTTLAILPHSLEICVSSIGENSVHCTLYNVVQCTCMEVGRRDNNLEMVELDKILYYFISCLKKDIFFRAERFLGILSMSHRSGS